MFCLTMLALAGSLAVTIQDAPAKAMTPEPVDLELERDSASGLEMLRGVYRVPENRVMRTGRTLGLDIIVLPAKSDQPEPDPVFFIAGGPGQQATTLVDLMMSRYGWMQEKRDLVFVDQRGTGGDHLLQCTPDGVLDVQTLLDPLFDSEWLVDCAERLSKRADLRFYTTPIAADDLDEVRRALGYEKINLIGGSYGTRATLVYLRRHEATVRTAILNGVAPIAFRNPLYHASGAQGALEGLFERCASDPFCAEAFPDLAGDWDKVWKHFEAGPVSVTVRHPQTREPVEVRFSRAAFAESVRGMLYSSQTAVLIPRLLHAAAAGDLAPFASAGAQRSLALSRGLALGMLLSVTCPEDVARIRDDEIEALTRDTFLASGRVRSQQAICARWPRGELPAGYGQPVRSKTVPVLLLSGTLDPVTPPRWGVEAARHLERSRHVVVEGSHFVGGECLSGIVRQFLLSADPSSLDTSCAGDVPWPAFDLGD